MVALVYYFRFFDCDSESIRYIPFNLHNLLWWFSPGSNGIAEWTIIELQGELESKSEEALGGKLIGDLHYNHDVRMILICENMR